MFTLLIDNIQFALLSLNSIFCYDLNYIINNKSNKIQNNGNYYKMYVRIMFLNKQPLLIQQLLSVKS